MEDLVKSPGLFQRFVDIFILALAIGVNEDKIVEESEGIILENPKNIPRNTIITNSEVSERIEFLYQNAVLNSKHLSFNDEIRMKLAFDDEFSIDGFRQWDFITKFANYGMKLISEKITNYDMLTLEGIVELIRESCNNITLEEIEIEV
jgi:hypothetical protein